jgi:pyruvate formate-lyase activating enzyme-like uncharacterized protein
MNNPEIKPTYQENVFNPANNFDRIKNDLKRFFEIYSDKLDEATKKLEETKLQEILLNTEDAKEKALKFYAEEMAKIEKYKTVPILFEPAEKAIKDQLNATVKTLEEIAANFISKYKY